MRRFPIYQIDAFADDVFCGNPAAVCLLPSWLPDATLLAMAAENNLSETAFLLTDREPMPLRWFTPREEVPLCGHATMAAGFVVLNRLDHERSSVTFDTQSGELVVERMADGFRMDFPAIPMTLPDCVPPEIANALGIEPVATLVAHDDPNYYAIFDDERTVGDAEPDLDLVERLHPYGLAISAPGREVDFVSRYFAPGYGIPEDPVTGSIHCSLGPYWSRRLGRSSLVAVQLSRRRGRIGVRVAGPRVFLSGPAVCYLTGEISVQAAGR